MAIPAGRFQAAGSANKCKVSKEFGTLLIINEEDAQMKIQTRYFGEVEIGDEKIVHFDKGLFGFEEYKDYTILYDIDGEEPPFFSWLQSTTEPGLAFPIVNPQRVDEQYNPIVEDALLEPVGEIKEDDLVVFLLATVPADVKRTSVNKKAPLIINAGTRKGVQIVAPFLDGSLAKVIPFPVMAGAFTVPGSRSRTAAARTPGRPPASCRP